MFFYFVPYKCYLILQKEGAEIFVYRWGRLEERSYLQSPLQLKKKLTLNYLTSITVLIDYKDEILEAGVLPTSSFFDRKLLLMNYLNIKFPIESWFGGMYLKAHQKDHPFVGVAFQDIHSIKAWLLPLRKKGINIHLSCFIIEVQNFLKQKLEKIEKINSFILLMPWDKCLKQMFFLMGEIRHLRTIKKPSTKVEYSRQVSSFSYYMKRQYHLTEETLPIIYIKMPIEQKIPDELQEIVEIQDLTKEVVSYIKRHRLSRFRMLKFPNFKMFSCKKFIYKCGFFCLLSFTILGALFLTKYFWGFQKEPQSLQKKFQPLIVQKQVQLPVTLYLAAIFYVDEKTWTLWINDQKITTPFGLQKLGYDIINVTEQAVSIKKIQSKKPIIILKPNQSFIASKGCIKEGKWH